MYTEAETAICEDFAASIFQDLGGESFLLAYNLDELSEETVELSKGNIPIVPSVS